MSDSNGRTADLDSALRFVIGRIEDQATVSGEPLNEEQRLLLNYLPEIWWTGSDPERPLPRNINYERLCALGKAARLDDLRRNPASLDWDFAFAVLKLNRHPMRGLLQWAGVKDARPWFDYFLLIVAAPLFVLVTVAGMVLLSDRPWATVQRSVFFAGFLGVMVSMYLASQRLEKRQLEKDIERCRRASPFLAR